MDGHAVNSILYDNQEDEEGQVWLDPAAFDLELIAIFFDDNSMRVWAAALLRERLRSLATRLGWS